MTFIKHAAIAALSLVLSATAALAAPAVVTTQLNVRDGPGKHYDVIDVVYRGEVVDVDRCKGRWCFVNKDGPNGWVFAKYLSSTGDYYDYDDDYYEPPRRIVIVPDSPDYYEPPLTRYPTLNPDGSPIYGDGPGDSFCFEGPDGYFCMGD